MIDKNVAALMRDNVVTCHVRFVKDGSYRSKEPISLLSLQDLPQAFSDKIYTYVTDLDLKAGDHVIVMVAGCPKAVIVESVDDTCDIDPKDEIEYKWVVQKISYDAYQKLMEDNKKITDVIRGAYKNHLRSSFRNVLLAGVDPDSAAEITKLLNNGVQNDNQAN